MRKPALRSAAVSDPGHLRENNEDRVHHDDEHGIYIVIDGVGGEAGGEEAAKIAESEVMARLERNTGTIEDRIREGIALAGKRIWEQANRRPELAGMSCVLTIAVVTDGEAVVGHVGDTRLYKIRNGSIEKLTRDHSPVGVREDAGEISEFEAMRHPRRNEIFRDVGSAERAPNEDGFIDVQRIPFEKDSALLLCSDGLTDQVASSEIAAAVGQHAGDPWRVARELIRRANDAGGKDNVSVVYVEGAAFARGEERETVSPPPRATRLPLVLALLGGFLLGALAMYFLRDRVLAIIGGGPAVAGVLTVSHDGAGAFRSISEALDRAKAGDLVVVDAGIYRERLRLKEGVSVVARSSRSAVLQPKPDAEEGGAAVTIERLRSGLFSGFTIAPEQPAAAPTGVLVVDSEVELLDLNIEGTAVAAILVRGDSKPLIRASYIHDNLGPGIVVQDRAAPRLLESMILRNGGASRRAGLEILGAARPTLTGNVIAGNFRALQWDAPPDALALLRKENFIIENAPERRPDRGRKQ